MICRVCMCTSLSKERRKKKPEPELIIETFPQHTLQSGDYFRHSSLCLALLGDRGKTEESQ